MHIQYRGFQNQKFCELHSGINISTDTDDRSFLKSTKFGKETAASGIDWFNQVSVVQITSLSLTFEMADNSSIFPLRDQILMIRKTGRLSGLSTWQGVLQESSLGVGEADLGSLVVVAGCVVVGGMVHVLDKEGKRVGVSMG